MINKPVSLRVPNSLAYLPVILNVVREMAGLLGFDEESMRQLELGTEEAVSNVIKYAFDGSGDESFEVILEPQCLGMNIIIREQGMPFDPALIHQYSTETLRTDLNEKGLGTFLMKQFLDEVSFRNLGKKGKETHLFKHINNRQIHEQITAEELSAIEREKTDEPFPKGSIKYLTRRMHPEEAVEVSKCAYSAYGYTYVHEDIYYPDRVRELNKSDNLISFVAVTDQAEIIAHNAFELREGDLAPELGVAFTKPKFRGQGCLNHLITALLEEAEKREFVGIYARGVTTHVFSQKPLVKFGFKDSAIYLSSGTERTYKGGIRQDQVQRESVVIMFNYLKPPREHVVYLPPHHAEIIKRIYAHLGVSPDVKIAPEFGMSQHETVTKIRTDASSLMAHITMVDYGHHALEEVRDHLKMLCLQRFETIHLHLPLHDPLTSSRTADFEALGFFFSGIMPSCTGHDELILQYLNNYTIHYDALMIESEMGKTLLKYIMEKCAPLQPHDHQADIRISE